MTFEEEEEAGRLFVCLLARMGDWVSFEVEQLELEVELRYLSGVKMDS